MSGESGPGYTGVDNLETMRSAVNYNGSIVAEILRCSNGAAGLADFGAGEGFFAEELRTTGKTVLCIERDGQLLSLLNAKGFSTIGDVSQVREGSIDFIYTLNVLEHIDDDVSILRQLHRCLKKGGRLFVYVPAMMILYSAMDKKVGHLRRYSRPELSQKVREAGFRICENRYRDTFGFFAAIAYKLVGNRRGDVNPIGLKLFDRYVFPLNRFAEPVFGRLFGKNIQLLAEK